MKNIILIIFFAITTKVFSHTPIYFEEVYLKQSSQLKKKMRHQYQSFLTEQFYNRGYCEEVGDGYDDLIEKECQRVLFSEQENIFKDRWYKNFVFSFENAKMNGRNETFDVYNQRYNMAYGQICDFSLYVNTSPNHIIQRYHFSIYCD